MPDLHPARQGHRLARFVQAVELLVTFGGCPHGPARQRSRQSRPNEPVLPEKKLEAQEKEHG